MKLDKEQIVTDNCGWCNECNTYFTVQESDFYDCDICGKQICEDCMNKDDNEKHLCNSCLANLKED